MKQHPKRFPDTNGWGCATFTRDVASGTWMPFGESRAFANTCHAYHTSVKARDSVYTSYAQR